MIQDISNYYLDKDYKIGDDIEFNIEGKQKTYEIKGFFTSDLSDTKNTALSAATIKDSEVSDSSNIYVDFKNHINIKKRAANISDLYQINILKYNEEMMSLYGQSDLTSNITLLTFLCCCLLILFSQLIIKNTIHMSVLERTKDFGILRCIGISQKKLSKILYKEAFILGLTSISLGLILSYITLKLVEILTTVSIGDYFEVKLYPSIIIISIILVSISLVLALLEPKKTLAKISPLEAIRSSFIMKKEIIKKRKVGSRFFGNIFGIEDEYAYKNIMRDKGSFITILIAFTMSISLFTTFNGILKTMMNDSYDENPESSSYYDGYIYMEKGYEDKVSIDSCLSELKEINGVEDVKPSYLDLSLNPDIVNSLSDEYKNIDDDFIYNTTVLNLIKGYDKEELNMLKKSIVKGDFDADSLKDDEVIIANYGNVTDHDSKNKKVSFFDIDILDEINIKDSSNSEASSKVVKVVAIIDGDIITGTSPVIIFSKDGFEKVISEDSNIVRSINIKVKNSEVNKELNKYIRKNPQYEGFEYYNSAIDSLNKMKTLKIFTSALLIIIGIVSSINILNSMDSKQVLIKKEFALLRVIGMNKKKLCKMIVLENSLVLIISSILGVVIGNSIGYSFVALVSNNDSKYITPVIPMIIGIIVVSIMATIFSIISVLKIKKQNIVEDIKDVGI